MDGTAKSSGRKPPLSFLMPGWFALVMGLCGLALAWHRAVPAMGALAAQIALGVAALASLAFVLLALASLLRLQRHPEAWAEDLRHPVRHAFVAAIPISLLLLVTVAVALHGPLVPGLAALWWLASLAQLGVTVWVLARWWRSASAGQGGLGWPVVTPALFIPIVGNVLTPLAGVPLGFAEFAAAQFGIGLLFWPLVLALLLVRIAVNGLWPERLLPAAFILIAPPAVIGLAALQLGAPALLAWLCWGIALFTLLWVATLLPRIAKLPFAVPHWAMSFPLAAMAALTLRLAELRQLGSGQAGGLMQMLAVLLLATASLIITGLLLATWRGLRNGSLLAPEPVAAIQPVAAPPT